MMWSKLCTQNHLYEKKSLVLGGKKNVKSIPFNADRRFLSLLWSGLLMRQNLSGRQEEAGEAAED